MSLRDVEELLAERGIEVNYETIRRWTIGCGPQIAANLRKLRSRHLVGISTRWSVGYEE